MRRLVTRTRHSFALLGSLLVATACSSDGGSFTRQGTSGTIDRGNGVQLAFTVVGQGKDTAIVVHGGPALGSSYLQRDWGTLLKGTTLIFYDQRGTGYSSTVSDSLALTVEQDIADLDAVRDHFHLAHPSIIGHHLGTAIAALYARRQPDHVGRLLLVSPFYAHPRYVTFAQLLPKDTLAFQHVNAMMRARGTKATPGEVCRAIWGFLFSPLEVTDSTLLRRLSPAACDGAPANLGRITQTNNAVLASIPRLIFEDSLKNVPMPVLVLEGAGAPSVVESARAWSLWAPQGRVELLGGPTLFPWVNDSSRFRAAAESFLGGQWPLAAWRPDSLRDTTSHQAPEKQA
jgi:pimeloyl-ACP methyl ester carboxylesterase